jgi:hypothetical protein
MSGRNEEEASRGVGSTRRPGHGSCDATIRHDKRDPSADARSSSFYLNVKLHAVSVCLVSSRPRRTHQASRVPFTVPNIRTQSAVQNREHLMTRNNKFDTDCRLLLLLLFWTCTRWAVSVRACVCACVFTLQHDLFWNLALNSRASAVKWCNICINIALCYEITLHIIYRVLQKSFNPLYAFFWVITRRLNFICRRFGTRCLFHLRRQVGMKYASYLPAYEEGTDSAIRNVGI